MYYLQAGPRILTFNNLLNCGFSLIHVYIRDINGLYEQGIKHHLLEIQSSYRQSDSLSLSHTHTHTHTGLEGQPET